VTRADSFHAGQRLRPWQRQGVLLAGAVLLLTGLGWLALHYRGGLAAAVDGLPHPLEAWALRLHGLAAYVGLLMFGVLAAGHVPLGWRLSQRPRWAQQRASGLLLCGLAALLAASGYALYYFAPEWFRPTLGWTHAAAGLLMAAALVWHQPRRAARRH
jgi:hypothetical protein